MCPARHECLALYPALTTKPARDKHSTYLRQATDAVRYIGQFAS